MKNFFVLDHDFNTNKIRNYNIIPTLLDEYRNSKKRNLWWPLEKAPTTREEYAQWLKFTCVTHYSSKAEWEFLIIPWPPKSRTPEDCVQTVHDAIKLDVWEQIRPNFDILLDLFLVNIKEI